MGQGQNLLTCTDANCVGETLPRRARSTRTFANDPLKAGQSGEVVCKEEGHVAATNDQTELHVAIKRVSGEVRAGDEGDLVVGDRRLGMQAGMAGVVIGKQSRWPGVHRDSS